MCGILGEVSLNAPADRIAAQRRLDRLRHRGPDGEGIWQSDDRRVVLGHRRLAVIDLTPGGQQPMHDASGRLTVVFNGEIYNHRALRMELEARGHAFRSRSDTEVLLAAWAEWGTAAPERFNGMFAFAVFDRGAPDIPARLHLVRDRAGKKPLYYLHRSSQFAFASELKAIEGPHSIDAQALNHYLALGYIPGTYCIAAGVAKLPPGHRACFDLSSGRLELTRWWALPQRQPDLSMTLTDAADRAGAILEDAVRLRMESDVPVGVLLSGGLDSSLIAAIAARTQGAPIRTFTFAQPGHPLDESIRARRIAQAFGTDHHEIEVADTSLQLLSEIAPTVDEPIADSSLLPTWIVCRLARQHVTVALGGDGGDELFGGYGDYAQALRDERRIGSVPKPLLRAMAGLAATLPAGVRGRNRLAALRDGAGKAIVWGSPYFDATLRRRILTRDALSALDAGATDGEGWLLEPEAGLLALYEGSDGMIDAMTRTHFGSILPDDFLVKVDRASMAHSLEMRSPLLDWRLVEFAFGELPSRLKVGPSGSRLVQRELARRWLPQDADFSRKQGFSIPIDQWLRADGERLFEQWSPHLPEAIHRPAVRGLLDGLARGRANGARLYALLMLAMANGKLREGASWTTTQPL
jgi:asparagine synthase (glutamine-hydrolysing)